MKYLITGGAGFIGSHLAERLLEEGNSVTIVDDLSTGRLTNIAPLQDKFSHCHIKIDGLEDVCNTSGIVRGCDFVFHLAASVGMKLVIKNPIETLVNNIDPTATLLAECSNNRPILIASTSEVYGKQKSPLKETDDSVLGTGRRWNYAISKLADEALGLAWHEQKGLPVTIARMFNVVGARQSSKYGMVVPRMVKQALTGQPLTIYGDGNQTRCFLPVEDAVDALILLSRCPEAVGEVVNVGSTEELTMNELAHIIGGMLNATSSNRVSFEEAYYDGFEEIMKRVPDVSKLKSLTGWTQKRTLEKAIRQIAEELKE